MLTVHIVLANESNIYLPGQASVSNSSPLLDLDFNNSSISITDESNYALITYRKERNLCSIVGKTSQKMKRLETSYIASPIHITHRGLRRYCNESVCHHFVMFYKN